MSTKDFIKIFRIIIYYSSAERIQDLLPDYSGGLKLIVDAICRVNIYTVIGINKGIQVNYLYVVGTGPIPKGSIIFKFSGVKIIGLILLNLSLMLNVSLLLRRNLNLLLKRRLNLLRKSLKLPSRRLKL